MALWMGNWGYFTASLADMALGHTKNHHQFPPGQVAFFLFAIKWKFDELKKWVEHFWVAELSLGF